VDSLVTAVAGIQSVINPDGFGGGCEDATPEQMLVFGPAQIANRERAVTPDDFESLAIEASRQVRKARCVPNQNASQQGEVGWVSVYIVPDSSDPQPTPTLELRRTVSQYLEDRVVVTVADQQRIFVGAPNYVVVGVEATVYATSLDAIGEAEDTVRQTLATFLHPLTGGPGGEGWDFGRELAASDLYAVLEDIDTVDHVGTITLGFDGQTSTDRVTVGANQLLAGGEHSFTMDVGAGD
jgi:predicted phage baseplate assembly protein